MSYCDSDNVMIAAAILALTSDDPLDGRQVLQARQLYAQADRLAEWIQAEYQFDAKIERQGEPYEDLPF